MSGQCQSLSGPWGKVIWLALLSIDLRGKRPFLEAEILGPPWMHVTLPCFRECLCPADHPQGLPGSSKVRTSRQMRSLSWN